MCRPDIIKTEVFEGPHCCYSVNCVPYGDKISISSIDKANPAIQRNAPALTQAFSISKDGYEKINAR